MKKTDSKIRRKKLDLDDVLIIAMLLLIVLGAILVPLFAVKFQWIKFTPVDFAPQYQQLEVLKEDFDKVYEMENASISKKRESNEIKVTLDGEECNLTIVFDSKSTEIVNVIENSNAEFNFNAIVLLFALIGAVVGAILIVIFLGMCFMIMRLKHRVENKKEDELKAKSGI